MEYITTDVFDNVIVPKLSALDLNRLQKSSKYYQSSPAVKKAFLKSLDDLSVEDFNAMNPSDNLRMIYLEKQLQKRAFAPTSYLWFLKVS